MIQISISCPLTGQTFQAETVDPNFIISIMRVFAAIDDQQAMLDFLRWYNPALIGGAKMFLATCLGVAS